MKRDRAVSTGATGALANGSGEEPRPAVPRRLFPLLLLAIVVFAGWVRLTDLGGPALWLDEILHERKADRAAAEPWTAWLRGLEADRANGPLYYGLQLAARRVAAGETASRLAPALAGVATVAVVGIAGAALGGTGTGLAAALLLSTSPLHVFYSREGRPYALLILAAALLLLALAPGPPRRRRLLAWAAAVLGAYTALHSTPILLAAAGTTALLWIVTATDGSRRWRSPGSRGHPWLHLLGACMAGLALIGMLYIARAPTKLQAAGGGNLGSGVTGPFSRIAAERLVSSLSITGVEWARFEPEALVLWGLAAIGIAGAFRRGRERGVVAGGMFLLPLALALMALAYRSRWYSIRYTSPALPAFIVLAALGAVELGRLLARLLPRTAGPVLRRRVAAGLGLLAAALPATANFSTSLAEPRLRADWRRPAAILTRYGAPGERVVASNHWSRVCLEHYLGDAATSFEVIAADQSAGRARELVEAAGAAWLVTGGFHRRQEVRAWMAGFHPVWRTSLENLALYYYPDFAAFVRARASPDRSRGILREFFEERASRLEFTSGESIFRGSGWSDPEVSPEGITFIWALGRRSELALPLPEGEGHRLRLRAHALDYPGAAPQGASLELNGRPIGVLPIDAGWQESEVTLPAEAARAGLNLLVFEFARADAPAEVIPGAGDARALSVAFDSIALLPAASGGPAGRESEILRE